MIKRSVTFFQCLTLSVALLIVTAVIFCTARAHAENTKASSEPNKIELNKPKSNPPVRVAKVSEWLPSPEEGWFRSSVAVYDLNNKDSFLANSDN